MDRKPSVAALALLVLCASLLVGCAESQAEAAADEQHPLARAAAPAAPAAPAATEMAPPMTATTEALEVAADKFAQALLTHDLTGLTMAFSPGGLAQAQALTAETGTQRGDGITAASVATFRDLKVPERRWEVYLDITGKRGDVQLRTVWQWFDTSGWRIVAIELIG